MNNTISALQQQYPLSPRKFWKKLLPFTVTNFLYLCFLAYVIFQFLSIIDMRSTLLNLSLFFLLAYLAIVLIRAFYINAYIKRYYYSADKDFITIKKGVFAPTEIHVQYQKIQDVYVDQDLFDKVFGLYDVHIASATMASSIEAHIDGVNAENAEGLKNMLLESIRSGGIKNLENNTTQPVSSSQPIKVNLDGNFSSDTFPIAHSWIYRSILNNICTSFIFFLIFIPIVFFVAGGRGLGGDGFIPYTPNIPLATYYHLSFLMLYFTPSIIFSIIGIIYSLYWKQNYRFEFTPEYIFVHQGVIGMSEIHVPYNTIQDVMVSQGIFEKMFGIYSVTIQNAAGGARTPVAGGVQIPGQTLENANKISEFVRSLLKNKDTRQIGL